MIIKRISITVILVTLVFPTITYSQIESVDKCGYVFSDQPNHFLTRTANWGYGYDSLLVDLERWGASSFVTVDSLGASVQNRALWELTIADNPQSSSNHRIYIHARTHPGEEESFWVTNEIINFLISDTPLAAFIRSNCIFHIIPMYNPDGVELGYNRENANGVDIESGWDDVPLELEVAVLKNRFIELTLLVNNPIEMALNMHSSYSCKRYFVYHDTAGTSESYTILEQQFINGVQSYFLGGFEDWDYFVSWTSGTPDQYPESWWWMNHGENVMALTYEDMNCDAAGSYDSTAYALVLGICEYIGLDLTQIQNEADKPSGYSLLQNYPNPFNPVTKLRYDLPENSHVNITIYDMLGRAVKTMVNQHQNAGHRSIIWDGTNDYDNTVSTGIYLYQIQAGAYTRTKKMVFLK
ncbi:MAG: M14 family zinc carboxypeptidase [Candidatus Marinimicrobia bacterium]|nr:M14 family zinc carboxypeptidase [Candidatus Neomarinimicrobiota bacterium]